MLGYPDQAVQQGYDAVSLAQTLGHPMSLSIALSYLIVVHISRQEWQVAQSLAETSINLAIEQGFDIRLATGRYLLGVALVGQGEEEGIKQMQLGLKRIQGTGIEHTTPSSLAGLAEGYAIAGQTEQGLNLLDEALAISNKTGNRFWDAELHRLKGELLLMHDSDKESAPTARTAEVEACFHQAIDVARRQQAKSLELRATTSLCWLWQAQGKCTEAHALLTEIYGWFTEGFDTADLIKAKALLEALQ
jgi:hypothetical protein